MAWNFIVAQVCKSYTTYCFRLLSFVHSGERNQNYVVFKMAASVKQSFGQRKTWPTEDS